MSQLIPSDEDILKRVKQLQDTHVHAIPEHWGSFLSKFDVEFQKQAEIYIVDIVKLFVQMEYVRYLKEYGFYSQDRLGLVKPQLYTETSANLIRWTRLHGLGV